MKQTIFIYTMVVLTVLTFLGLSYIGLVYYSLPVEQRFFHPLHQTLKPSGPLGHGLGIVGSMCMIVGVSSYMIRKRKKSLVRVGTLKNWLEFHIFLCSIGPIMVLFHTAFKFGGIVAISFWSMVAVVISGVIGRFIYNQIPRSIQGRELSLNEVMSLRNNVQLELDKLSSISGLNAETFFINSEQTITAGDPKPLLQVLWSEYRMDQNRYRGIKANISSLGLAPADQRHILKLIKSEWVLRRKIGNLQSMQKLFRSWHVVHLPFALIMLIIMIIHVIITLLFGYRWIF